MPSNVEDEADLKFLLKNLSDSKDDESDSGSYKKTKKSASSNNKISKRKYKVSADVSLQNFTITTLGMGQLFGDIDFVYQRNYTYSLKVA